MENKCCKHCEDKTICGIGFCFCHTQKASQPSGEEWEKEFQQLWNFLVDWAGSGFRYDDASFTATGLKEMKPKFKSFISRIAQEERERGRREVLEEIPSGYMTHTDCELLKQQLKIKFKL